MKSFIWVVAAGAIVAGTGFVDRADAAERGRDRQGRQELRRDDRRDDRRDVRRDDRRDDRRDVRRDVRRDDYRYAQPRPDVRRDRFFYDRDIVVIRDYYRPRYRPARGVRFVYAPNHYLPAGWHGRLEPIPFALERRLPPVPRGYRRGLIDGYAVVYSPSGFILDAQFLF